MLNLVCVFQPCNALNQRTLCHRQKFNVAIHCFCFMSQSIPTGYIPLGNPRENVFERANPGHPGKFFCLIPCPGAKYDGPIPRGWGTIYQTRGNSPLSLQKILKKFRKLRDSTNFCLENLRKLLYFRLKQNHSEVFKCSSLQYFN